MKIRTVKKEDAPALQAIYAPYVRETAITFEYEVPSVEEFQVRIEKTLTRFPYLVVEEKGQILGYAYASSYYDRSAYDWTVELSVYLHSDARGKGLGSLLYDQLEQALKEQGYLRFLACIALPNEASIRLHKKRGYQPVAHFPKVGYKFGQWHDIVWLQKNISGNPQPIKAPQKEKKSF